MAYEDFDDDGYGIVARANGNGRRTGRHPINDPALIQAFLAQGDAWRTVNEDYVRIDEMTPGHALATANFVLDRARSIALVLLAVGDERVTEVTACEDTAARLVIIDTPLVQALIARGAGAVVAELPWASVASR